MALKRTNGKFEGAGRFKEVVFGGTEEVLKKYANKLSPAVFSLGQKDLERLINDPDADMGGISEDEKAFFGELRHTIQSCVPEETFTPMDKLQIHINMIYNISDLGKESTN